MRPYLCRTTPWSDPVPTVREAGTYTNICSSNWIGRGGKRQRFVYVLSYAVCDVCAICALEPRVNCYQGRTGLRHFAPNRKVADSIPDGVTGIFH